MEKETNNNNEKRKKNWFVIMWNVLFALLFVVAVVGREVTKYRGKRNEWKQKIQNDNQMKE